VFTRRHPVVRIGVELGYRNVNQKMWLKRRQLTVLRGPHRFPTPGEAERLVD
jgi:hypothetical protein